VAKVPLFADLNAAQIAGITDLLTFRHATPGETIVKVGDPGDGVYFITEGTLKVDANGQIFTLAAGDFFGEIALLHTGKRTATVTAVSTCELLFLSKQDFEKLLADNEALHQTVSRVAQQRLGKLAVAQQDDSDA